MPSHTFQASILTSLAVVGACAAITVPALPVAMTNASLPEDIRAILTDTHTEVQQYRAHIAAGHVVILANRRQAAEDIRAVIDSVRSGETDPFTGQIWAVVLSALTVNHTGRYAIAMTHKDIREARGAAGTAIRAAISDTFDGSTIEEVHDIVDTAQADIAADRSLIRADAAENGETRRSTAVEVHAVVRSAAAGEIDKDEASAEIKALATESHTQITANHVEMASTHADIKSTKKTAAKDVHNAVKDSRPGGASGDAAKK
ncbi:hypothetical protein BH09ACT7_BH09ACT7_27730 [soil metagenome]